MKRKFVMWVSRWSLRMIVKFRRFCINSSKMLIPKHILTDNQDLAIRITHKAIILTEAELFISPLSATRYIRYKDIIISIENAIITIINVTYSYHISIPEHEMRRIINKFNFQLEHTRKSYEVSIQNKAKRNLTNVLAEM